MKRIKLFALFALVDPTGEVKNVIVADQAFVSKLPGRWVETDDKGKVTKNLACLGCTFDESRNGFIQPKPFPSWVIDEKTLLWVAPKEMPKDGTYGWDEERQEWMEEKAFYALQAKRREDEKKQKTKEASDKAAEVVREKAQCTELLAKVDNSTIGSAEMPRALKCMRRRK